MDSNAAIVEEVPSGPKGSLIGLLEKVFRKREAR